MEDMNNTDRLVALDARSADRVVRLRCAHSPDCPVADLPGLLMEFPNEVLRNPALMLAAAADPGLMLNWPDYAVGIVACSSEAALAAPALKRESAARDFAMWWSSRGLEPFVAGKHEYAYGSLTGSLALEEEREMRALRHLLAVSGISAATIDVETGEKGRAVEFQGLCDGRLEPRGLGPRRRIGDARTPHAAPQRGRAHCDLQFRGGWRVLSEGGV